MASKKKADAPKVDEAALVREYGSLKVEIKERLARLAEIEKSVSVEDFVFAAGRDLTGKSKQLVLGDVKFTVTATEGKPSLDSEAALALVQQRYPKLVKELVVNVPQLDETAFTAAVAADKISKADFKKVVKAGRSGTRLLVEKVETPDEQPLG